jgi:hypothetical protein
MATPSVEVGCERYADSERDAWAEEIVTSTILNLNFDTIVDLREVKLLMDVARDAYYARCLDDSSPNEQGIGLARLRSENVVVVGKFLAELRKRDYGWLNHYVNRFREEQRGYLGKKEFEEFELALYRRASVPAAKSRDNSYCSLEGAVAAGSLAFA